MAARFMVQTTMKKEDMIAFQRAHRSKWRTLLLWGGTLICVFCAVLLWVWNAEIKWSISVVALLVLAASLFSVRINAWSAYRSYNRAVGEAEFRFDEDGVHTHSALEDGTVYYGAFVKLLESRDYFFLYVQKNSAFVLPKKDFTIGDPNDFAAFIHEKTQIKSKCVN